jgi:hypothetical protein
MTKTTVFSAKLKWLAPLWMGLTLIGACDPGPVDEQTQTNSSPLTPGVPYYYGTDWTSDENPNGVMCTFGDGVAGVDCRRSKCDDMSLTCRTLWRTDAPDEVVYTAGSTLWSPWISEETPPKTPYQHNGHTVVGNVTACETSFGVPYPQHKYMNGIRASGNYSDDISIRCDTLLPQWEINPTSCRWTGEVSDNKRCPEDPFTDGVGYCHFAAGEFAVGVRCTGSNCDNMSFYVCKLQRAS